MPFRALIFDKYGENTCGAEIKDYIHVQDRGTHEISYSIECDDGYSYNFPYTEISNEIFPQKGEFGDNRVLQIKVPINGTCKITINFKGTCNWCCGKPREEIGDKEGLLRIFTWVIEDFNYYDYMDLFPGEKMQKIKFEKYIDADYEDEEFNKDCVIC